MFVQDLGTPKSDVFQKYGMTEENAILAWGPELGIYQYPKEVTYLGQDHFSVTFDFDITKPEREMYAFTMYKIFDKESKDALAIAKDVFQTLNEMYPQSHPPLQESLTYLMDSNSLEELEWTVYADNWVSGDNQLSIFLQFQKYQNKEDTEERYWVLSAKYGKNPYPNGYREIPQGS